MGLVPGLAQTSNDLLYLVRTYDNLFILQLLWNDKSNYFCIECMKPEHSWLNEIKSGTGTEYTR